MSNGSERRRALRAAMLTAGVSFVISAGITAGVSVSAFSDVRVPASSQGVAEAEALIRQADAQLAEGHKAEALALLKRAAVRLQNDPRRVNPLLDRIATLEKDLGPAGGDVTAGRRPHARPAAGQVITFESIQTLGNFPYDPDVGGVPADVKALDGVPVRVPGYMIPLDQVGRITRFALVPDLFACCFGQPPGMEHTILVQCPPGQGVSYYPDRIEVEGTLRVEEKTEDGFIVSLFELDATSVKAMPK